jgi:hypothetical protein
MTGEFHIIYERVESFTGKRGKVEQRIVTLLDQDLNPLLNTVDYVLSEDEKSKYPNKCTGKKIELAVSDIRMAFGGRLRLQGRILKVA